MNERITGRRALTEAVALSALLLLHGASAGAIVAAASPPALDLMMGMPLLVVPGDGEPVGAVYGHPPAATPGLPLPTPIGLMGFGPSHMRTSPGSLIESGSFMALTGATGPIAGSTVHAPTGSTAIDLFMTSTIPHTFEITAVGSTSSAATIVVVVPGSPTYVGFGAFGETITLLSIVKLPFPSPTTTTWTVEDIRVLPAPGAAGLMALCLVGMSRRRNR